MKNFKVPPGMNPVVAKMEFDKKLREAWRLEGVLEETNFQHEDEHVKIIINGKPEVVELEFKSDLTAQAVMDALNAVLEQAYDNRQRMANELIHGTKT